MKLKLKIWRLRNLSKKEDPYLA